jgi:phage virion morphogenesis protein
MIVIEVDDHEILEALRRLQNHSNNLGSALHKIGDKLAESTKKRFATKTGPDGNAWLGNAESTIWSPKKLPTGGYSIKGRDDPLVDQGILGDTIDYQLFGNDGVDIGSPMEYAAMMQFGGAKSEFPNLWGDIPGRPFLGISEEDKHEILAIIQRHLSL